MPETHEANQAVDDEVLFLFFDLFERKNKKEHRLT